MKVRQDKYGSRRPKLEQDDLTGDFAVLTITEFGEENFADEEGDRVTPYLLFKEMGDKVQWLNATQIGYLIERLGEESDAWKGQPVPIERHVSTFRGKRFNKLWVAAPEEWDAMFEQSGTKPARRARRAGKAKRKAR